MKVGAEYDFYVRNHWFNDSNSGNNDTAGIWGI